MELISQAQKQIYLRLNRPKFRKSSALFPAEGLKCIQDLLRFGAKPSWIAFSKPELAEVAQWLALDSIPLLDATQFPEISHFKTPAGLIGLFHQTPLRSLEELTREPILALDALQDPGNVGTILRTAHWFGISQVVFLKGCADPFNPKTVQSTMGSLAALRLFSAEGEQLLQRLQALEMDYFALDMAGNPIPLGTGTPIACLVVGSESHGVSAVFQNPDRLWAIPPANPQNAPESLNAAVSLAAALGRLSP